jgi:rhodanese-related sulfurtransferase
MANLKFSGLKCYYFIIIDGLFTLLSQIRFELQSVYKVERVKKKKYILHCTYGYKKRYARSYFKME